MQKKILFQCVSICVKINVFSHFTPTSNHSAALEKIIRPRRHKIAAAFSAGAPKPPITRRAAFVQAQAGRKRPRAARRPIYPRRRQTYPLSKKTYGRVRHSLSRLHESAKINISGSSGLWITRKYTPNPVPESPTFTLVPHQS